MQEKIFFNNKSRKKNLPENFHFNFYIWIFVHPNLNFQEAGSVIYNANHYWNFFRGEGVVKWMTKKILEPLFAVFWEREMVFSMQQSIFYDGLYNKKTGAFKSS